MNEYVALAIQKLGLGEGYRSGRRLSFPSLNGLSIRFARRLNNVDPELFEITAAADSCGIA